MYPNTPKDNNIFFHWLFKKFIVSFIVFINRFKSGKKISFMKESSTIIFNTFLNSLDKMYDQYFCYFDYKDSKHL